METTRLGETDIEISRMGLGCMGMSEFYGSSSEVESIALIHEAIDRGVTLLDTADMYGSGANERLVGQAIKGRRDQVKIATKFGIVRGDKPAFRGVNGRPEYVRAACDASLHRIGIERIDLYYQHRVDPSVPIEETVGAMKELVAEGKVAAIGLSEAAPETIRRAHAIHPISALQTEYSLWTRDPEREHLATCRELGITFVAYSPLGRGFLTGAIRSTDALEANDFRRTNPRFQGNHFTENQRFLAELEKIATEKSALPAQIALAWLLAQGNDVVPIPGTRRLAYLEQNLGSFTIELEKDDLERLNALFPLGVASGDRYPSASMAHLNR